MITELVSKSLYFDYKTLRIKELSFSARVKLLKEKTVALVHLAFYSSYIMRIGRANFRVDSISELGTLQSCIVDLDDNLFSPQVISSINTVVDVGANVGQWSTAMKLLNPSVQITAIEPEPNSYQKLKENLSDLDNITTLNLAASKSQGSLTLFRQKLVTTSTLYPTGNDSTSDPVTVRAEPLDNVLRNIPKIDVLKIDVEGAELSVIEGATETLAKTSIVIIEISLDRGASNALEVFSRIIKVIPSAKILKFGRPLGYLGLPICQDVVLKLD